MLNIFRALKHQFGVCLLFAGLAMHPSGFGQANVAAAPLIVQYGGVDYQHRWSKGGQHEFTPAGQENLSRWQDMVTINVHPAVRNGDQLAALANQVVGRYGAAGKVIMTNSVPRTEKVPAQHLVVAVLRGANVAEAVFARFVLLDDQGSVIVYSRREYGPNAAAVAGQWLEQKGSPNIDSLMQWTAVPSPAVLRQLPNSQ